MCWWDARQLKAPLHRQPLLVSARGDTAKESLSKSVTRRASLSASRLSTGRTGLDASLVTPSGTEFSGFASTMASATSSAPLVTISGALGITACVAGATADELQFIVPTESGDMLSLSHTSRDEFVGAASSAAPPLRRASSGRSSAFSTEGFGVYRGHVGPVTSASPHPFVKGMLASGADWTVRLWNAQSTAPQTVTQPVLTIGPLEAAVTAASWSTSRASVLYTTLANGSLLVWDLLRSQTAPVTVHKVRRCCPA